MLHHLGGIVVLGAEADADGSRRPYPYSLAFNCHFSGKGDAQAIHDEIDRWDDQSRIPCFRRGAS